MNLLAKPSFCTRPRRTGVGSGRTAFFSDLFTFQSAEITDFSPSRPTVTEKGYESESYSETEDDHQATKPAVKDPAPAKPATSNKQEEKKGNKKNSANTNKGAKQASIVGFFQKK